MAALKPNDQALVPQEPAELAPLSAQEIKRQVQLIQEVMQAVMQEGLHYGVIPGTQKPTLLKPGAEKLCLTFRLASELEVTERDLGHGHREYRVQCTLRHIRSGQIWGTGVGLCSTMESRYRWRYAEAEDTGRPVPKPYWQDKDPAHLGGKDFVAKRNAQGLWTIHSRRSEKIEHPDIADVYNTVLKMAKKRAHVDATLTATAASDCFTQDLEEEVAAPEPVSEAPPVREQPKEKTFVVEQLPQPIDETARRRLFALLNEQKVSYEQFRQYLGIMFGVGSIKEVDSSLYPAVLAGVQGGEVQHWLAARAQGPEAEQQFVSDAREVN